MIQEQKSSKQQILKGYKRQTDDGLVYVTIPDAIKAMEIYASQSREQPTPPSGQGLSDVDKIIAKNALSAWQKGFWEGQQKTQELRECLGELVEDYSILVKRYLNLDPEKYSGVIKAKSLLNKTDL
jgi:hypothetical protein